jgi:hypothetical protein
LFRLQIANVELLAGNRPGAGIGASWRKINVENILAARQRQIKSDGRPGGSRRSISGRRGREREPAKVSGSSRRSRSRAGVLWQQDWRLDYDADA